MGRRVEKKPAPPERPLTLSELRAIEHLMELAEQAGWHGAVDSDLAASGLRKLRATRAWAEAAEARRSARFLRLADPPTRARKTREKK
jgi:hypothetical protein